MKNKKIVCGLVGFFIGVIITTLIFSIIIVFITKSDNKKLSCITSKSYSQKVSISKNNLLDVYKEIINETTYNSFSYGVIDINDDGVDELIIKSGDNEADYNYYIYTYDEAYEDSYNHVVLVGEFSGGHSVLYKMNDGTLMHLRGHMGVETVTIYSLENDWLVRKSVVSNNIGNGNYTKGDKKIELVSSTDLSMFE